MNEKIRKLIDTIPVYRDILGLDIAYSVSDMDSTYIYQKLKQ